MEAISHNDHGDFKRVIDHHYPNIGKAFHQALAKLNSYTPQQRAEWDARTFPCVMHSHICAAMRRVFADVDGAKPGVEKVRAFVLQLDGAPLGIPEVVQLKCKQLNSKLITSNIPTDAVKAFNKNAPRTRHVQDTLHPSFGPPKTVDSEPPAHGVAGYIFDAMKTGFDRLGITYLTGLRSAELVLELSTATGTEAEVITLPMGEITEAPKKVRVTGKKKADAAETPKKRIKTVTSDVEAPEIIEPKEKEQ